MAHKARPYLKVSRGATETKLQIIGSKGGVAHVYARATISADAPKTDLVAAIELCLAESFLRRTAPEGE